MKINLKSFDKWQIVSMEGRFVGKYLSQIRKVLEPLEQKEHPFIALDFSATTHMDSSAITLIVNYHRRLVAKIGKLVLFGANEDINGIFSIVGLNVAVPLFKTMHDFELSVRTNNI